MITIIKEQLKDKIKEIGFNYNSSLLWNEEMIYANLFYSSNDNGGYSFPTFDCVYYPKSQYEGIMSFQVRFSKNNEYIDYVDINANIHIILY